MENPNNIKRTVRIPKEVYAKAKKEARDKGISINKIIVELIKDHFKI